ncbi:MAG: ligase-associated DNA damage response DEXH box helicase [Bacteroidota bacterium]
MKFISTAFLKYNRYNYHCNKGLTLPAKDIRTIEKQASAWFRQRQWKAAAFQTSALKHFIKGYHGLVNAPTGSGKTYSLGIPAILHALHTNPLHASTLNFIWLTPLKALAVEIKDSLQEACNDLGLNWQVAIRNGDTPLNERLRQKKHVPQILITTPESLHLLMASKGYEAVFKHMNCIVIDEWHELLGSKRGVQTELAISRLKAIQPTLSIWGISATIGNLDEAMNVLIPYSDCPKIIIRSEQKKKIKTTTLLPDEIESYPWAGHMGLKLLDKIKPLIKKYKSTLAFTNTRGQAEAWYQAIITHYPQLIGKVALHHGSLDRNTREWVENALHEGKLKLVVCTSSLDLGVDFRPVECVVQIGSPKGVARFLQRAGRSNHQPGKTSNIYFLPTNALELIEIAAIKIAIASESVESKIPVVRAFDVLVQYLVTLAVSDGLKPPQIYGEIAQTHAFNSISEKEWDWCMQFIVNGGDSLKNYPEYRKVEQTAPGLLQVTSRKTAMRHRMQIGTISSDNSLIVKYLNGSRLGNIEEYFITKLNTGDCFTFAGKTLELIRIDGVTAYVKQVQSKKAIIPSWEGGRMSLSTEISGVLRHVLHTLDEQIPMHVELQKLMPLLNLQNTLSIIPDEGELLIEEFKSDEGYHIFCFPFEGRMMNEGMAMLLAYRFSLIKKMSISIAMNDFGFELLSDQEFPDIMTHKDYLFNTTHLEKDLAASTNYSEMAGRKFNDIASISGLIFKGTPDQPIRERHLRANSRLFYEVFKSYDTHNLLLLQAYEEVYYLQLEEVRLRQALRRISMQKIVIKTITRPTPFSLPMMTDRLREFLSNEKIEDRVKKMLQTD